MNKINVDIDMLHDLYFVEMLSQQEVANKLGISQGTVSSRIREQSHARPRHHKLNQRKYHVDESCFDEIKPEAAWVLGWLVADGFVSNSENYFGIKLAAKDSQILDHLKKFFKYTGPILDVKSKIKGKVFPAKLLKISSKNLRDKLIQLGVEPAKSGQEKYLKCISGVECHRSFIRGIYEGDGSLLRYTSRCKFQIVGTKELLSKIQKHLIDEVGVSRTKLHCQSNKSNHYLMQYSGSRQVLRIADWIYEGAQKVLQRKFNVYKTMRGIQ